MRGRIAAQKQGVLKPLCSTETMSNQTPTSSQKKEVTL
jgi:hypothetical protein